MAAFGLGFGLTVTPRSTAAVESAGRTAFGMASATVTVARMIGMAVGLAVLTAYGSTTIERLTAQIYATPDAYKAFLPADLVGRPFRDGLVIAALERWASGEAARIMVGLFLVAAVVTVVAALPALALGSRRARMLASGSEATLQDRQERAERTRDRRRRRADHRWRRRAGGDPRTLTGGSRWSAPRARAPATVRVAIRSATGLVESTDLDAIPTAPFPDGTTGWIDISGPSADQVAEITRRLGLHELIAEDILEGNQRAKIEVTEDRIHVVMFALQYGDPIRPSEIDMVLGDGFLLTVHAPEWDPRPTHHLRGDGIGRSSTAAPTTSCGRSATTSSTATSR